MFSPNRNLDRWIADQNNPVIPYTDAVFLGIKDGMTLLLETAVNPVVILNDLVILLAKQVDLNSPSPADEGLVLAKQAITSNPQLYYDALHRMENRIQAVRSGLHGVINYVNDANLILINRGVIPTSSIRNPLFYLNEVFAAERRMDSRYEVLASAWRSFSQASGPRQVQRITTVFSTFLIPNLVIRGMQGMVNFNYYGTFNNPPRFFLNEPTHALAEPNNIRLLSLNDIRNQDRKKSFVYVITENHELLIAAQSSAYRKLIGRKGTYYISHADLARYPDNRTHAVFSAGELVVQRGQIIKIEGFSGHFCPHGETLKTVTESFFISQGYREVRDRFKPFNFIKRDIFPIGDIDGHPLVLSGRPEKSLLPSQTPEVFLREIYRHNLLPSEKFVRLPKNTALPMPSNAQATAAIAGVVLSQSMLASSAKSKVEDEKKLQTALTTSANLRHQLNTINLTRTLPLAPTAASTTIAVFAQSNNSDKQLQLNASQFNLENYSQRLHELSRTPLTYNSAMQPEFTAQPAQAYFSCDAERQNFVLGLTHVMYGERPSASLVIATMIEMLNNHSSRESSSQGRSQTFFEGGRFCHSGNNFCRDNDNVCRSGDTFCRR